MFITFYLILLNYTVLDFPLNLVQQLYNVSLQCQQLTWVDQITHLGHILCANIDDAMDIRKRMSDFACQVNYFLAKFSHLSVLLRSKLFANFCQSFYGSQLWLLTHKVLCELEVVWRKAVRRVWHLPRTAHYALLPIFARGMSLGDMLHVRFTNVANSCLFSDNYLVSFISSVAISSQRHTFGCNSTTVCWRAVTSRPISLHAIVACELVFVRDGLCSISNLAYNEVSDLLFDICCNRIYACMLTVLGL